METKKFELKKFKLLLTPIEGVANLTTARQWAESLRELPGVTRIEFDTLATVGQRVHDRATQRDDRGLDCSVVISLWGADPPQSSVTGYSTLAVMVEDRVGYGFEGDRVGPVLGYKKLSFWKAKEGLSRSEWDPLYAHHIVTVPELQPIWRYRQNIIIGKPARFPYDAISENWWRTLRDLDEGYFFSEEAKRAVMAEVSRFIDLAVTTNFVCRSEVIFIA